MTDRVLYYPYIKVPQNSWFTRVLLYWDKVGSIVPYDYIENPEQLGEYMSALVREELVIQVIPGMYLWNAPNFTDAFIEYIDMKMNRPVPEKTWARIHMEKLQSVGDKLCERGLARKDPNNEYSPWYQVESNTADEFMSYLASVLGQLVEQEKFYPITDQRAKLSAFMPKGTPRNVEPLREIVLRSILPAPAEALEPGRLAEFKAKYYNMLKIFRREVEDKISELSVIENDNDRNNRLQVIVNKMKEEIQELTARMREQKNWPRIDFAAFCALSAAGLSSWKAVIDQDWRFGLGGAAFGLAPVVYNAFRGSNIQLEDKPLAYASVLDIELM